MGKMRASAPQPPRTGALKERMLADHRRIEELFRALLSRVRADDWDASNERWTEVESSVMTHMDAEEAFALPRFEHDEALEAASIRAEHDKVRSLMATLGLELELHAAREDQVLRLAELLHAHAVREERMFYVWAERVLPDESARSLLGLISRKMKEAFF
jgi:hemerythrin superfamily protein